MRYKSNAPTLKMALLSSARIKQAIECVFNFHNVEAMELDTLIYFALQDIRQQGLLVMPDTYNFLYERIRECAIREMRLKQGDLLQPSEVRMRRIVILRPGANEGLGVVK